MVEEFGEISQISIDFKKILMENFTEVFVSKSGGLGQARLGAFLSLFPATDLIQQ